MNQDVAVQEKKLKARDFINTGIFSVLYIIIFFVVIVLMSLVLYTQPFGMAVVALVGAPVYMLLRVKVPKPGGVLLFGGVFALVMFVTGGGWPMALAIGTGTVIAEIIAFIGKYKSFILNTVGYIIITVSAAMGTYIPLLTMRDYYLELSGKNNLDAQFMINLMDFVSGPLLAVAFAVTAVAALLGALLARAMFKKHFIKAGLMKEVD